MFGREVGGTATLKQIARAAGVSVTTVSNVINGNLKRVSGETADRVRAIIEQADYIPNQAARALAQRESRLIVVNLQAHGEENVLNNPYSSLFIGALTVRLHTHDYYPLLRFTDDFQTVESDIRGWNAAGAIFSGTFDRYLRQIKSLTTVPCVLTDCYYDIPGVNHVGVDDRAGGRAAAEFLRGKGHSRVGFIANSPDESPVERERLAGFREVMPLPDSLVLPSSDLRLHGGMLLSWLASGNRPTAMFCASDLIALHVIRYLNAHGFNVPEDISVVGFDDLPLATMFIPRLTTVAQDVEQKAWAVADMLVRHIRDKSLPPECVTLGVRLVERESVAPRGE